LAETGLRAGQAYVSAAQRWETLRAAGTRRGRLIGAAAQGRLPYLFSAQGLTMMSPNYGARRAQLQWG
jgi:hypothetical protein